jgi:hypothetical protein
VVVVLPAASAVGSRVARNGNSYDTTGYGDERWF